MAEGDDPNRPISLFYSYSHRDEDLRDRLHDHLAALSWNGAITDWHDRKIPPGAEWEDAIDRYLTSSDIVLLLVSASFIASPYCRRKEMMKALERHDGGEATVIPVILRYCRWKSTSLGKLQALPKDGKPVTAWADQDEAFDDVVAGIERVVEELRQQRAKAAAAKASTVKEKAKEPQPEPKGQPVSEPEAKRPEKSPPAEETATLAKPAAPAVIRETADVTNKHGSSLVHVGVDPRTLPDLAVFKDIDAPWCPEMVVIPKGSFLMGSPRDSHRYAQPQHQVTIDYRFALGRYAVTFEEYDRYCAMTKQSEPNDAGWGRARRPVINVSWDDAVAYCEWLSHETGEHYRLPSEAEWEYACRAGTVTDFSLGGNITLIDANYDDTCGYGETGFFRQRTVAVSSLPPNPWGLYEMHGNTWEWILDGWHENYDGAPRDGSAWITSDPSSNKDNVRIMRGGAWNEPRSEACSAHRSPMPHGGPGHARGFRVVRRLE